MKRAFLELVAERLRDDPCCHFLGFEVSRHGLSEAAGSILDMPISEETIVGVATGLARVGAEAFVDLMFDAFAFRTIDVLTNQAAVTALLPGACRASLTIRMLCGPFPGAGPQHGGAALGLLARLPDVSVAAPCTPSDLRIAYAAARPRRAPLILLTGDGALTETAAADTSGLGSVRSIGGGDHLSIVCFGHHAHLVVDAVARLEVWDWVTIHSPLFVSPLPTDRLVELTARGRATLVVDGPAPASIGDLITSSLLLSHRRIPPISTHALWRQGVGASFDRERCVSELAARIEQEVQR